MALGLAFAAPADAQSLSSFTSRTNFDAAFPASSTTERIEDFSTVTADFAVSQTTPDTWDGFTLVASGTSSWGPSNYCASLSTCVNWTPAPPNAPGIYGAFGDGILEFDLTENIIGFGTDHYDWNDEDPTAPGLRSQLIVTLSDGSNLTVSGTPSNPGDPGGFIGFKLDDASIYAGITISDVEWQRVGTQTEIVGLTNITTIEALPDLQSNKSGDIWDPNGDGLYATPGNEIVYNIEIANSGLGVTDVDTMFLVDSLPAQLSFWNGDIDSGGPDTFATIAQVGFSQQNGASMSFDPATDFGVSFSTARPTDFSQCSSLALDNTFRSDVRHLCFNIGGQLDAAVTIPEISLTFRTRIN